jgi:hypothetical protein
MSAFSVLVIGSAGLVAGLVAGSGSRQSGNLNFSSN